MDGSEGRDQQPCRTVRLLIADDNSLSRVGLRALLATFPGIQVVGEAGDGREAVVLAESEAPDVVLMDALMPGMDGLEATRAIKDRWPEVRVVILTLYGFYRPRAAQVGADAFLLKGCPTDELLEAITGPSTYY